MTLFELLREARLALGSAGIADLDARLLVEHVGGASHVDLLARPDQEVDASRVQAVREALARRLAGEPVYRILGWREFYGLRLELSPDTLEPRPDTEILVDAVLPFVRDTAQRRGRCRILDLGTGSGAIALALLAECEGAEAVLTDISAGALAAAGRNAERLRFADRVKLVQSDWFQAVEGVWDVIVSNPPYIRTGDLDALPREVLGHDPHMALDGGADGLVSYRIIAEAAKSHLDNGGRLAVEIGFDQKQAVIALFERFGFRLSQACRDYGGNDRVLVFVVDAV